MMFVALGSIHQFVLGQFGKIGSGILALKRAHMSVQDWEQQWESQYMQEYESVEKRLEQIFSAQ